LIAVGLLAAAFFVGGIWGVWHGSGAVWIAVASTRWPGVPGLITASWVSEVTPGDEHADTLYQAAVTYRYTIAGRALTGTSIRLVPFASADRSHADEDVSRYPVDAEVTVYYDPARPEVSTLEPGASVGMILPIGIGLCFVLFGLGLGWGVMAKS
jgi:hypothetical protein